MFKTQTKWKLGALLLAAPLAFTAVSVQASDKDPKTGDWHQTLSADLMVGLLKAKGRLRNSVGDVYIFRKDGTYEFRRGKKTAKDLIYVTDYGRFTVKQKSDTDNRPGGADLDLVLKVIKSKKTSNGKVISRPTTNYLAIQQMSNHEYGNDPDAPLSSNEPVKIYYRIDGKRFD